MHILAQDDLLLTWSPQRVVKKLLLDRCVITHDPPRAILDLLKANGSELGIIYVNSVLVPWTLCMVSSCVREFRSRPYLFLSTLSSSTSWPPFTMGEERQRERKMNAEREGCTRYTAAFYLLHDRGHLAALLSISALLHSKSGLHPRQLTHIDALRTSIMFLISCWNDWSSSGLELKLNSRNII